MDPLLELLVSLFSPIWVIDPFIILVNHSSIILFNQQFLIILVIRFFIIQANRHYLTILIYQHSFINHQVSILSYSLLLELLII